MISCRSDDCCVGIGQVITAVSAWGQVITAVSAWGHVITAVSACVMR